MTKPSAILFILLFFTALQAGGSGNLHFIPRHTFAGRPPQSLELAGLAVCLSGISLHVILKAMNSKGEKALELHKEASSEPDLELLLHHTEHVEEGEEDAETPQH